MTTSWRGPSSISRTDAVRRCCGLAGRLGVWFGLAVFGRGAHAQDAAYRLGVGDVVSVLVYHQPELTGEVVIDDACAIALGLIGTVPACGRSPSELQSEIVRRYDGSFLRNPSVAVRVVRYRSQRVDVLGEVERPGPLYLEGATTLPEIISLAGGTKGDGIVEAEIIGADGARRSYRLDRLPTDASVQVRAGDRIVLQPSKVVYVEGELEKAGVYPLTPGLTVSQALTLAGGTSIYANLRRVAVIRDGQVRTVDIRSVLRGDPGADDPQLLPNDHVVVKPKGGGY
jgi:protein involved in polysaccharide export with SLBB domain